LGSLYPGGRGTKGNIERIRGGTNNKGKKIQPGRGKGLTKQNPRAMGVKGETFRETKRHKSNRGRKGDEKEAKK